ncbi:MAG TPA: DUF2285 domain-containing protein [Bradyrhizobium sp.]|nr:DUF2285 domain-containing protein [Bradyrhizobium sp.]
MIRLLENAPSGDAVTAYDRHHLALYAALLNAEDASAGWRETATELMRLDPDADGTEACWRSHLDRARWIVGVGLGAALTAFGESVSENKCRR